jgi:hypothetical protein
MPVRAPPPLRPYFSSKLKALQKESKIDMTYLDQLFRGFHDGHVGEDTGNISCRPAAVAAVAVAAVVHRSNSSVTNKEGLHHTFSLKG